MAAKCRADGRAEGAVGASADGTVDGEADGTVGRGADGAAEAAALWLQANNDEAVS